MAMNAPGIFSKKAVNKHLHEVGARVHDQLNDDGESQTKDEALAELLWKMALGYTETVRDEDGTNRKVVHLPVAWAMQYIVERKEGKAVQAIAEEDGRIKAADKVRELARDRMNKLAVSKAGVSKGPPSYKPKKEKP
jgi:hypothetical protein